MYYNHLNLDFLENLCNGGVKMRGEGVQIIKLLNNLVLFQLQVILLKIEPNLII